MNTWLIAFLIGNVIGLTFLVLKQQSTISSMKNYMEGRIGSLPWINDRTRKIETAVDWFLERKGLKLERRPASCEWAIMPSTSPEYELDSAWKQIQMHREEIVYALYEANKRALEDHDKEKSKKRGK